MHPAPPPLRSAAESLLEQLQLEERLLVATCESVKGLHGALRRGDLPALKTFHAEQEQLAESLQSRARCREVASAALAEQIGIMASRPTLREIAARLPADESSLLLDARRRLQDLTQIISQFQSANANLIAHLRSYFRGVLSTLLDDGRPTRYAPGGIRSHGTVGLAVHATG